MTSNADLESAIESFKSSFDLTTEEGRAEWDREFKPQIDQLRETYPADQIDYCLSRFVTAELDFETPGERGLGRLSTEVPRYGAHLRKHLRRASPSLLEELELAIRTQILTGFLAFILPREDPVKDLRAPDDESLFRNWIPNIYSGAMAETIDEQTRGLLAGIGAGAFNVHNLYLRDLGFRGGGFFTPDKTEIILFHYHIAGYALRVTQHMMAAEE